MSFNGNIKQQISGLAIGATCAPTYACIFVDELEWAFLQIPGRQSFLWLKYTDDIFIIWNHGEKRLQTYLDKLNKFHLHIKFTHGSSKEKILFLDLNIKLWEGKLETNLYIKPTERH